jgi:hypothetical protein
MVMQDPSIEDVATARLAVGGECLIAVRWYHDPKTSPTPSQLPGMVLPAPGPDAAVGQAGAGGVLGYNEIARSRRAYAAFE